MDPVSIMLGLLAAFSAFMSVGQAVETYALWKLKKQIPDQIKSGVLKMLSDPETKKLIAETAIDQETFDALAVSLWTAFKNHIGKQLEGQIGKQGAAEKAAEKDFVSEIAPFVDLLPDKWRQKVEANPRLLPFILDLAQRFGPLLLRGQGNGQI